MESDTNRGLDGAIGAATVATISATAATVRLAVCSMPLVDSASRSVVQSAAYRDVIRILGHEE